MKIKSIKILKWGLLILLIVSPLLISIESKAAGDVYFVDINQDECVGCGVCIALDPYNILEFNNDENPKAAFFGLYSSADVEPILYYVYQDIAEECPKLCFTFFHY